MVMPPVREHTQAQAMDLTDLLVMPTKSVALGDGTDQVMVAYGKAVSIKTAAGKPAFVMDEAPPAIDGWMGAALKRTNADDSVDHVVVYNNAMAGEMTTFRKKYGVHAGASDDVSSEDSVFDWKVVAAEGYIPAKPAKGTVVGSSTKRIAPETSFSGTFDGVAGTFMCVAGSNCVIERSGLVADGTGGVLSATSGEITFKATDASAEVKGDAAGHLAFGWWLTNPAGGGEVKTFGPFAGGSGEAISTTNLQLATGGAVYSGPAAGRYVMRDSGENDLMTGVFTADAELEAQFSDSATMVKGKVTGFQDADGGSLGLTVTLLENDLSAGTPVDGRTMLEVRGSRLVQPTSGDPDATPVVPDARGTWTASFYEQTETQQPNAIAGTFGAHAGAMKNAESGDQGYAAVGGAFGATQQ